ncbi:hypothetical protein DH2020_042628 [Rehmannia glutinosa]|uniref:Homeodomain-like superfamily protein n=1 Tax=Rehmannia glutinosa TaxID=99300 RepID=A0ABR0UMW7_REHGL
MLSWNSVIIDWLLIMQLGSFLGLIQNPEQYPLHHENEVAEENKQGDGNGKENVAEEEDEDEDADFNPFLKETNSVEASSSLSSEVEDLDTDVADSRERPCAPFDRNSEEKHRDITKDCQTSENVEHGEEIVMQTTVSSGEVCGKKPDVTCAATTDKTGSLCDKENGSTGLTDVSNATDSRKPMVDMDAEGAICMRTRARYSLASFTLDELETFLQETDDEDDLQNVDDEEEYRKFLAGILIGDDSQNLLGNANADDEDEENDADFELELEEALESEPEEVEERRVTRRNRCKKASLEGSKKLSGKLNRPLRPLLPFASIGSFPAYDGKHLTPNIAPSYMPPVNNGFTFGFTPHQIGQLHCLIHEHVQLLIQVFSLCVLEPVKNHTAAEVKELVVEMLQKRDQVLAWRTVPYPSFCFSPPYIHPSVSDGLQKMLPPNGSNENVQRDFPTGSNREPHSDVISLSSGRHIRLPDEQAGTSQTPECTSWVPYVCGPVLSVIDVAPLRLVENYIDDVASAVRAYERYQIELGFQNCCQKEPLFPLHNFPCSAESDDQGEMENNPPDSSGLLCSSSSNQMPKKTMAATLLEKAKNQSVALVPKEIAKLAQRFWPLFNPALYPRKPPPAALANRVLFTDAEDELLALGLMEYNTDWKAIQQRFLPCKSRHQIFVRQKNRASSKALENPIKAVRRMKNSSLTSEEIARDRIDPSLLPRQWRIACGTQKSYKSDANKKEKRRLYELRRKTSKPSPSTWHSSSEKEVDMLYYLDLLPHVPRNVIITSYLVRPALGDSTDNAVEETNSDRINKEDEAYVHEAFLADWRPDNNVSSVPSREGSIQPQICSKSPAALSSQVVLRPYRARRPNSARLVKLAPDLPPVNLPPSVRVMSQSAFKSSQSVAPSNISGNASRIAGLAGSSVKSGPSRNDFVQQPNHPQITINKGVAERGGSDLQMHPLLFQAPQDGHLRYYPVNSSTSTSSSFTFFSGKQPQLSLSLFHNPRHIRDAVNFLSESSKPKPPGKNASPFDVDFHPLLQRNDDLYTESISAHSAARLSSIAEPVQRCASLQNPSASLSTPSIAGSSSASGTKATSRSGKVNELDLDIHLSFTSKNREGDIPLVTSRNKGSRKVAADTTCDDSLLEIIMEQEELSDSEEEFGENVEFECEEMADSEGDSMSDSEQVVNIPNEEVQLDEMDADIDDGRLQDTQSNYGGNIWSTSDAHSSGLELAGKGVNVKPNVSSLNLNSCPPISPLSNPKNAISGYEFGPFRTTGAFDQNQIPASSKGSSRDIKSCIGHMQKRSMNALLSGDTLPRNPRKRVCRSNSKSSVAVSGKGNSSPDVDTSVEILKNVSTDKFG